MTRFLILILAILFFGCAKSPYQVNPIQRVGDGFFSPFSRRVVPHANLIAEGNHLFIGTRDGDLLCIDADKNEEIWRAELQGTITTTPFVSKKIILAGTAQGMLYALKLKTGKKIWEREFPGALLGHLQIFQGRTLLVGANDGSLYALDVNTGRRVWRYSRDLPEEISIFSFAKPALGKDRAYVGFWDGTLAALNVHTGEEIWARRLPRTGRFVDVIAPLSLEAKKVFASQFFGSLHVTNEKGDDEKVLAKGGSGAASIRYKKNIIVGTAEDMLVALDADTLEKIWTYRSSKRAAWSGLMTKDGKVLASTYDGRLHIVDAETGEGVWTYDFHSALRGAPVEAAGKLWILTERGALFSLNPRSLPENG